MHLKRKESFSVPNYHFCWTDCLLAMCTGTTHEVISNSPTPYRCVCPYFSRGHWVFRDTGYREM